MHPDKLGGNHVNETALSAHAELACMFVVVVFFRSQSTTISGLAVLSHVTVCTGQSKVRISRNELSLNCIMI